MKPTCVISSGDPAGIGPEVVLKALQDSGLRSRAKWKVVGSLAIWPRFERLTGLTLGHDADVQLVDTGIPLPEDFQFGRVNRECGHAALRAIEIAAHLCLSGEAAAMITAPVNKEACSLTCGSFTGHTEFIAGICGMQDSWMLLVNEKLSVVHVSTHCSLRQACSLDTGRILATIRLGDEAMRLMGKLAPRIGVCGLNPHAGENGLFGTEDIEFIHPAVLRAKQQGILCEGPLPADTAFMKGVRGAYDLIVAMYHDQGHAPMKLLDFERTVNVSLGLPLIRTSVDHGTAFDIAGTNRASPESMKEALQLAVAMVGNR